MAKKADVTYRSLGRAPQARPKGKLMAKMNWDRVHIEDRIHRASNGKKIEAPAEELRRQKPRKQSEKWFAATQKQKERALDRWPKVRKEEAAGERNGSARPTNARSRPAPTAVRGSSGSSSTGRTSMVSMSESGPGQLRSSPRAVGLERAPRARDPFPRENAGVPSRGPIDLPRQEMT